ncbi:MAG: sigma-70 family RNA polymerase sigma factor [Bacteroidota bacterium]
METALSGTAKADESLVQAITQEGKSDLFGILYDRYADRVYRKCFSFSKDADIAQDMVQDIFLKVFFQLSKFKGKSKFSTWLYAITYNYCVEHYRRNNKYHFTDIDDQPDTQDDALEEKELLQTRMDILQQALEKVAPDEKALLLMKYQDEVSIKEMMEQLNLTESAVKMRLSRARQRVRKVAVELEKSLISIILLLSLLLASCS